MMNRRMFCHALAGGLLVPFAASAAGDPGRMIAFFSGRVTGEGSFTDLRRNRTRTVKATLVGRARQNVLTLSQELAFSDGQRERRVWTFTNTNGRISGQRDDLIGEPEISIAENRARISYRARTPVDGSTLNLGFDETVEFRGDRAAVNTTRISLLFFRVAEMNLSLRKIA
jgi:hypothetical protein